MGCEAPGYAALLLQKTLQQAPRGLGVAPCLKDLVEEIAIVIDRPPKPVLLVPDGDDNLIEMSDVARARLLAPKPASMVAPELWRPAPYRLVGSHDAALQQHLLDQTQAQGEAEIQPYGVSDDWRRKPIAIVADRRLVDPARSNSTDAAAALM